MAPPRGPLNVREGALLVSDTAARKTLGAFVGVLRPNGLLAPSVAEVRVEPAPYLLIRDAVVEGKAPCLPTDVERLLGRGPRKHETIRLSAGRAPEGAGQRLR